MRTVEELNKVLDSNHKDWAARQELSIVLQASDPDMSYCQAWMAENKKCPSDKNTSRGSFYPTWGTDANPNKYHLEKSKEHMYLPDSLFRFLPGYKPAGDLTHGYIETWWISGYTREETERLLCKALAKGRLAS